MRRSSAVTVTFLAACILALLHKPTTAALIAFDHAGDSEYADGWQAGDNGGSGFGPWILAGGNFEIRSSTGNNNQPAPGRDIDSANGGAWAIQNSATPDPFTSRALAIRPLTATLNVGQTVIVEFDSAMTPNEEAGIALRAVDGSTRLRFYDLGAAFKLADSSGIRHVGPGGLALHGLHLEITLTTPDLYALKYNNSGGAQGAISGSLAGNLGSPIDRIVLDRSYFATSHAFYNNVAVAPEPTTSSFVLLAMLHVLATRQNPRLAHAAHAQSSESR